jgi:hypothetical protein
MIEGRIHMDAKDSIYIPRRFGMYAVQLIIAPREKREKGGGSYNGKTKLTRYLWGWLNFPCHYVY